MKFRSGKRSRGDRLLPFLHSHSKQKKAVAKAGVIHLKSLGLPLISTSTGSPCDLIRLKPDRPSTIGRRYRCCEFFWADRRVSRQHCQIFFDSNDHKVFLWDGYIAPFSGFVLNENGRRLKLDESKGIECSRLRPSLNGVFVNRIRMTRGSAVELSAGDEVSFLCSNEGACNLEFRIGFTIERLFIAEEVVAVETKEAVHYWGQEVGAKLNIRILPFVSDGISLRSECDDCFYRASYLLGQCRKLLHGDKPTARSGEFTLSISKMINTYDCGLMDGFHGCVTSKNAKPLIEHGKLPLQSLCTNWNSKYKSTSLAQMHSVLVRSKNLAASESKHSCNSHLPPGKKIYLNRLKSTEHSSLNHHTDISLPELLYPVEDLSRIFIATFTSDILWFLSFSGIPNHLPVTVACHNTERCWSSEPDKRTLVPYPDFPNLVVVFPPFPEVIAFGKNLNKQGIACHHPKLLVLQREDSIRVVITSANLVAKQWNNITNTVWWQDFPSTARPDYASLFTRLSDNQDMNCDFGAQLAGFMASLVVDVPSQTHWITELAKYDYEGANGKLVSSVPGIHAPEVMLLVPPCQAKFVGCVEASVVGLGHLFHKNGVQLKKLAAAFIWNENGKSNGINGYKSMSEIVLRRNTNIPADANAVSVFVSNPTDLLESEGDCIQLGFLPRNVAKWVAPLWDIGFFKFSGYVHSQEALETALGRSNIKVRLVLCVSQGPEFSDMSERMQPKHASALCTLIASIQRRVGLWRLQEVLGRYKWPENLETHFIYGSSSIGSSVNTQFLAAFSAAAGKRTSQFSDSEESDPEWGCWNASEESRNPSVKIVFPTVERVRNAVSGVLPSKRILCFRERTWQRLRSIDILHDAIPHPNDRVGHPMHVKVAQRRFQSKAADSSSFGWVYCGSHNFSPAAWGRPISNPFATKANGEARGKSVMQRPTHLHICNYELGIIFIVPPSDNEKGASLDDIVLPFVVPAPKYKPRDRPATAQAMSEALAELSEEQEAVVAGKDVEEEIPYEEEEAAEAATCVADQDNEEEKAYADTLWSQVDSSES